MDPNSGRFIDGETAPAWMTRYEVGEVLKVKGEEFEILEIRERELVLKPLSARERSMNDLVANADQYQKFFRQPMTDPEKFRHGRDRSRDAKKGRKP